ncbi:MAG: LysR substrate-binding domain-containing protein [Gammaproteobacteria bacterium]|nr:LysR substrate-binding domain-containing protein [Gammaproteobacteria bacterium]
MELRHLRYFKVVAELQHFHKAADKLCITQPALGNQIKQLEQELGTQLFDRVGRRVKLSESGELVLASSLKILNEVDYLKEAVSEIESGLSGSLRIGVLQSINALYLRDLVIEFDKNCPNISLHLEELTNQQIEQKVSLGELDLGIGFILKKDYKNIQFEHLFSEKWKLILSPDYAHLAPLIMAGQQHGLKAVLLPEHFETRRIVNAYFIDNNIQYSNITEINNISFILDLVEKGPSFSILPEAFSVIKSNHQLMLFDLNPPLSARTIGILMAENSNRKKTVEQFCKVIRKQLAFDVPVSKTI